MKKPARDAGAVNAKIKASVQDTRQGTVNAKITEEKSKGAPKKGRKRFALSSRTKKCIPIVMAQESEICRIAQY